MQPTEEQIKEFWEWCGLHKDGNFWYTSEGKQLSEEMPDIDLNNLFEWVVTKLGSWTDIEFRMREDSCTCVLKQGHQLVRHGRDRDPALALFWAIWKVIGGRNVR